MALVKFVSSSAVLVTRDAILPNVTVAPSFTGATPMLISGTGTPGAVVTVDNGLATQKAALVDSSGNWSLQISLPVGTNRASTVTVSDRNGAGFPATTNINITSQSVGPVITNVTASSNGNTVNGSANVAGAGITSVVGTLIKQPSGANIGPLAMTATGSGNYSFSAANVPAGTYVLQVIGTNSAGPTTEYSNSVTVTVVALDPIITVGGVATSNGNSVAGEGADKAFDGDSNSKFLANCPSVSAPSSATNPGGLVLTYTLPSGVSNYATSYQIGANSTNRDPKDFRLEGYNGSSWVTLDSRSNEIFAPGAALKTYFISGNATPVFNAYRLVIDQNNGSLETGLGNFGAAHVYEMNVRGLGVVTCTPPTLTSAGTTSFSGTAGIGNAFSSQVLPVVNSATAGTWTKTSGPAWVTIGATRSASITSAATAGTSTATATYSNGCAPDIVQTLTFTVANASVAPDVQGPLPTATEGVAYSTNLVTTGSPTAITVTSPSWLSAAFTGGQWVLSGTPPLGSAGTPSVTFSLTNASSMTPVVKSLPLTVAAAPIAGAIGAMGPYLLAAGSNVSYTIPQANVTGAMVSGAPAWASVVGGNLQLSPPAGTSGSFAFTIVGVSNGNPVTQNVSVVVGELQSNLVRLRRGMKSILTRLFKVV